MLSQISWLLNHQHV